MSNVNSNAREDVVIVEILRLIFSNKLKILVIAFIVMAIALGFSFFSKPTNRGNATVEIGYVVLSSINGSNRLATHYLDDPMDLLRILELRFTTIDKGQDKNLRLAIPKGSSHLIQISYDGPNLQLVQEKMNEIIGFIRERHSARAVSFKSLQDTVESSVIVLNVAEDKDTYNKYKIAGYSFLVGIILAILLLLIKNLSMNNLKK